MKTTIHLLAIFLIATSQSQTQDFSVRPQAGAEYRIAEQGPHHRVMERTEYEPAPNGREILRKISYTELATGMHYANERGELVESQEEIEILPNGAGAVARRGPHKVAFPPDIYDGQIELNTPDGKWLRSRVLGLSYYDESSGKSVLIAETTNSLGELHHPNVVLYAAAFSGLNADLRYTYTRAGFEQDVILRERPLSPEEFGLAPETTRLQILTEFFNPPVPAKAQQTITANSRVGLRDDTLTFGEMEIGLGTAFSQEAGRDEAIPVAKRWQKLEERDFLIEEVQTTDLAPLLERLSPPKGASIQRNTNRNRRLASVNRQLPSSPELARRELKGDKEIKLARLAQPTSGLVLDYLTVNNTLTNHTFQSDTTYFITGPVYLYGTNILEGGAVLKYTNYTWQGSADAHVRVYGRLECQTGPYRPAIFTAKDDNSVGETISGSTGNPSGLYGYAGLFWASPTSPVILHDVRISYLNYGALITQGTGPHEISDSQFCRNSTGLYVDGGANSAKLRNLLFVQSSTRAVYGLGAALKAEHLTIHRAHRSFDGGTVTLTNSLLVWVTNWPTAFTSVNNATNNDSSTFQIINGGAHYLATNSAYRNVGTTNINAELLAGLQHRTTYPPIAYTNLTSTYTALGPQAPRDTDLPDLGYHYDPLDYIFGKVDQETNLTFSAGTAVGWFRYDSDWYQAGHGIHIADTKTLSFAGQVAAPCYFVHQTAVQEQLVGYTPIDAGAGGITGWATTKADRPVLKMEFTRVAGLPIYRNHFRDDNGALLVSANHCEFYGGGLGGYVSDLVLTNCLLDRTGLWLSAGDTNYNELFSFRNCTVRGGYFLIDRQSPDIGQIKVTILDTVFDGTAVNTSDAWASTPWLTTYDFNALQSTNRTTPTGANDLLITNFNWQASWQGKFYVPTNSLLINAGSVTNAALAGFYHFTMTTNQVKEAFSRLDIGYHYVASPNGVPADTDGDGVPDYLEEDSDGDGAAWWEDSNPDNAAVGKLTVTIDTPAAGSTVQ